MLALRVIVFDFFFFAAELLNTNRLEKRQSEENTDKE